MNAIRFAAFKHENLAQHRFEIAQFKPYITKIRRRGDYTARFIWIKSTSAAAILPRSENIPHEPTRVRARYLDSGAMHESGTSFAWIESLNQREERTTPQEQNIVLTNILDFFGLSE